MIFIKVHVPRYTLYGLIQLYCTPGNYRSKEGGHKADIRPEERDWMLVDGQKSQMSDDVDRSVGVDRSVDADVGGSKTQESRCNETASA